MRAEVRLAWEEPALRVGEALSRSDGTYFEYDGGWERRGIVLNPLRPSPERLLALKQGRNGAPLGILGDAIPDGWGLRVLHARARAIGIDPVRMTPVDLLCLVGENGPGALTYHPQTDPTDGPMAVDLARLYDEADALYTGTATTVAEAFRLAAGPSGGARPKVLVDVLPDGAAYVGHRRPLPGATSYLIKFPTEDDGRDMGRVELAYAAMARSAGIQLPPTRPFVMDRGGVTCFGVERFDRPIGTPRPHVASLAGLLEADFRSDMLDYTEFLLVVYSVTRDQRAVLEGYRRMVFNVLAANRDDHMKNFAFLLPARGEWSLAPAFDLTCTPDRRHTMAIAGKDLGVCRADARRALAKVTPVSAHLLDTIDEEVTAAVEQWERYATEFDVPSRRTQSIQRVLGGTRQTFLG